MGLHLHLLPQQGYGHLGLREPRLHLHQELLHLDELVMVLVKLRLLDLRGHLPEVELALNILCLWRSLSAKRSFLIERSPTLFDNKSILDSTLLISSDMLSIDWKTSSPTAAEYPTAKSTIGTIWSSMSWVSTKPLSNKASW